MLGPADKDDSWKQWSGVDAVGESDLGHFRVYTFRVEGVRGRGGGGGGWGYGCSSGFVSSGFKTQVGLYQSCPQGLSRGKMTKLRSEP